MSKKKTAILLVLLFLCLGFIGGAETAAEDASITIPLCGAGLCIIGAWLLLISSKGDDADD